MKDTAVKDGRKNDVCQQAISTRNEKGIDTSHSIVSAGEI
jgi:hypothetical protein